MGISEQTVPECGIDDTSDRDVAGALSFPKQWSFENFRQAMEVTDFWRSLGLHETR